MCMFFLNCCVKSPRYKRDGLDSRLYKHQFRNRIQPTQWNCISKNAALWEGDYSTFACLLFPVAPQKSASKYPRPRQQVAWHSIVIRHFNITESAKWDSNKEISALETNAWTYQQHGVGSNASIQIGDNIGVCDVGALDSECSICSEGRRIVF